MPEKSLPKTEAAQKTTQKPPTVEPVKKKEKKVPMLKVSTSSKGGVGATLNQIMEDALAQGASDVHMEHTPTDMEIRFRIDGLLRKKYTIAQKDKESVIFKIKVAAHLRTDEHFAPQDGRIKFKLAKTEVDTRVSILPTSKGEKVVMRLLTKEGKVFTLENLGLDGDDLLKVQKGYSMPYGTILVCGPTGSGKTTTLYTILQILNEPEINITTVEDPVEYDIEGVNHVQINPKAKLTFATGLRSILRQDPDIVMIGEIRDDETARIAMNAAMTGHLVLSTLHTNDAVTSIPRLLDMGIEPYLLASTINVVISQRLARKLCTNCKTKTTLKKKVMDELSIMRPDLYTLLKSGQEVYEPQGCAECDDSGYKGRIGLFEVLPITKEIKDLISKSADSSTIYDLAKKDGFKLLIEDGVEKLLQGIISMDELLRVTAIKE